MKFEIKKFDLNYINSNDLIYIIGIRQSGKTTLISEILHHFNYKKNGIIMTQKDSDIDIYKNSNEISNKQIVNEFNYNDIEKFYNKSKNLYFNCSIQLPKFYYIMENLYMDFILELYKIQKKIKKKKELEKNEINMSQNNLLFKILNKKNNFPILKILSFDFEWNIDDILENVDWIFIFPTNHIPKQRLRLYNNLKLNINYGDIFPDIDTFNLILDECTNNYECLVIHNSKNNKNINNKENIYWYKCSFIQK